MKKYKGIIALLLVVVIVASFVACSSSADYEANEQVVEQAVTDENGEVVTNEMGEAVMETVTGEAVTNSNGQAVTETVTNSTGEVVTHANGDPVTQVVTKPNTTVSDTSNDKTTKPTNDKNTTTQKTPNNQTTKPNNPTKPTKPNQSTTKPNKPQTTVTTTEETTLPPTTAVGQDKIDKDDIEVLIMMPYYADEDAQHYNLFVKIGDDTLKYVVDDGCRGQQKIITVPKKYKGKKATFIIDVNGKRYELKGTIKKGLKIEFETIIIMPGEDD